ncbi:uncharacterized protein IL334_007065 [Kwoniella shivajii]|uniref:Uncharacterized protein n=1 Tax=Kwoniella shivajii TaxID=564305 RepID=A0ABZ1DAS5_9TREE|nr:hypothetical protein IL334_007065 [Kwoniella shivajii]
MLSATPKPSITTYPSPTTPTSPMNNPDMTGIEADDENDTSDDDQGVFLGAHQPYELNLISKLSSTSGSPSPIIRRTKKRDSREFMRRQTMLLPTPMTTAMRSKSILTERQSTHTEESDSSSSSNRRQCSCSTPAKSQDNSDLTLDFAGFHLSSPQTTSRISPPCPSEAGSDKENVPIAHQQIKACALDTDDMFVMSRIVISEESEEEINQIDMGGLRLSDFSDPETGLDSNEIVHLRESDTDGTEETERAESPNLDLLPDADISSSLDSPLPVSRAGPVVIPTLSSHHFSSIRAESGSPCRPLPPSPIVPIFEPISVEVATERMISPTKSDVFVEKGLSIPPTTTPSRSTPMPPPELVERGAKLLKASTSKPTINTHDPKKSASRVLAIRSQLDTAVSSRMGAMGPPQRSVSSSSTASSSSTGSRLNLNKPSSSARLPFVPAPKVSRAATAPRPPSNHVVSTKPPVPIYRKPVAQLASSTTRTLPRPALAVKKTVPAPRPAISMKSSIPSSIPLKRPAPSVSAPPKTVSAPTKSIAALAPPTRFPSVVSTRPSLGQPSRVFQNQTAPLQMVPVFSVGVIGENQTASRTGFRSPAKSGLIKRSFMEKGTPRKLGTPMRFGTPRQINTTMAEPSTFSSAPIYDISAVLEPLTSGPPATATRQSTENIPTLVSSSEPTRGSSEDHEEVSVQLAKPPASPTPTSPSPKKKRSVGRPKKLAKPQVTTIVVSKTKPSNTIVPNMSEKELKSTTHRNTIRNQVYHCAIDRQIVHQSGPRPPSPTSKIRTTAERNEEEKKLAREERAKRRKGQPDEEDIVQPVIEKLIQQRFQGDESDFETPVRPVKKVKTEKEIKFVKWDKGLTVIRDDGTIRPPSREDNNDEPPQKGCLRAKVSLDQHGNLHEAHRPIENLKRTRVVVTAVFYEGEEPVPVVSPASSTRSKKK